MPPDDSPSWWSDELAHEVRTAITGVKLHAQLVARVAWPTTAAQHQRVHERVVAIDEAATTALRHLNRLLAVHAARWPDGALQQMPGADPAQDRDPDAPEDGPLGRAGSRRAE